jgi:hypothetical protein
MGGDIILCRSIATEMQYDKNGHNIISTAQSKRSMRRKRKSNYNSIWIQITGEKTMGQFISFLHRPDNGDIAVWDLNSHSDTQKKLNLHEPLWCEGHYTPNGEIECRTTDRNATTSEECVDRIKNRFPSFANFLSWCFTQDIAKIEWLDLSSLTSAEGLTLPQGIKTLYLSSLTSADGLTLPQGIKTLDLSSDIKKQVEY